MVQYTEIGQGSIVMQAEKEIPIWREQSGCIMGGRQDGFMGKI